MDQKPPTFLLKTTPNHLLFTQITLHGRQKTIARAQTYCFPKENQWSEPVPESLKTTIKPPNSHPKSPNSHLKTTPEHLVCTGKLPHLRIKTIEITYFPPRIHQEPPTFLLKTTPNHLLFTQITLHGRQKSIARAQTYSFPKEYQWSGPVPESLTTTIKSPNPHPKSPNSHLKTTPKHLMWNNFFWIGPKNKHACLINIIIKFWTRGLPPGGHPEREDGQSPGHSQVCKTLIKPC